MSKHHEEGHCPLSFPVRLLVFLSIYAFGFVGGLFWGRMKEREKADAEEFERQIMTPHTGCMEDTGG